MVYEKDKIRRLIEYKDKIINEQIKNDLEWILEAYNRQYANSNEYEEKQKNYASVLEKYYNAEEEKASLKEKLDLFKRRYKTLKKDYRELREEYRACCKKLKSMI
jgi:predicted nuclease with TOPRIM domain